MIFFFGAVSPYLTHRNPIRFWGGCKLRVPGEIGLRFPISPDPAGAPPAGRHGPGDPGQGKMHHTILFAGLPGRQRCARLSGHRPTLAPNNPDPVPFSPPGKGGHTVSFSASRESPSASRLHPAVTSAVFSPPWRQAASGQATALPPVPLPSGKRPDYLHSFISRIVTVFPSPFYTCSVLQQEDKLEFARRAGGQVVTNVVCNRFHPFNLGMIATGNH